MTDSDVPVDLDLTEIATSVLRDSGFVSTVVDGQPSVLLAEGPYAIVIVGTTTRLSAVSTLNQYAEQALVKALASAKNLGQKKWDTYIVVLTSQAQGENADDVDAVYALNYDTRHARRIVRTGVNPTLADVRRALNPLLPLDEMRDESVLDDALSLLQIRLLHHGVSEKDAAEAIAEFRETKRVFRA